MSQPTPLHEPSWREWLNWLLRRRRRMRVVNRSMAPTLQPGDLVLVDPQAYQDTAPLEDDIVVAQHPTEASLLIIKRIRVVDADMGVYLGSDNANAGQDSRHFGWLPAGSIIGRVTSVARAA